MDLNYLPVNVENIETTPDKFTIELNDKEYTFVVCWNPEGEMFSLDLFDVDDNALLYGQRITYGVNILNELEHIISDIAIYPLDVTGEAENEGITLANFMDSVKPYIVEVV